LARMKIWQSQHVFDHPWEMISQAAWRKYPNPTNPNIVAIDVLGRRISADGALTTERLFTTKFAFPRWIAPFIPMSEHCYSTEKSTVNPQTRSMVLESRNLSLGRVITVDERLEYSPHPTDPSKTLLTQQAIITVNGLPLVGRIEGAMASTIATNATKGRQAMEWVVSTITAEAADIGRAFEGLTSSLA
jgi:hypothetical protein